MGGGRQATEASRFSRAALGDFGAFLGAARSWRKALEAFVAAAHETAPSIVAVGEAADGQPPTPPVATAKAKNNAGPGWRLRFLVNRRDRFSCRACGRSPATEPGVVLHVDHIVPWSNGGETTLENLQTLGERCNIGKSDLAMSDATYGYGGYRGCGDRFGLDSNLARHANPRRKFTRLCQLRNLRANSIAM